MQFYTDWCTVHPFVLLAYSFMVFLKTSEKAFMICGIFFTVYTLQICTTPLIFELMVVIGRCTVGNYIWYCKCYDFTVLVISIDVDLSSK